MCDAFKHSDIYKELLERISLIFVGTQTKESKSHCRILKDVESNKCQGKCF